MNTAPTKSAIAVSLIIPTLNEAPNIARLLDAVRPLLKPWPFEIIVVDDSSPDGTAALCEAYALHHPDVRILKRTGFTGLSAAVVAGFAAAKGSILGVMDADLSHDENILPALIKAVTLGGNEMAIGSRRVPGGGATKWPWYRQLTSAIATKLTQRVLTIDIKDPMSGYFVMTRALFERCQPTLSPRGYKIMLEIFVKAKPHPHQEIPYIFRDRRQGHSKICLRVALNFLASLFDLRGRKATVAC